MGFGVKNWLKKLLTVYLVPVEIYASESITVKQHFLRIALPILSLGFLGVAYQLLAGIGPQRFVLVYPLAYVLAALGLISYLLFIRTVLWILGFNRSNEIVTAFVYTSPYLLPALLILYLPFTGLIVSLIVLPYQHYLVARTMRKHYDMRVDELTRLVKQLLIAEYIALSLVLFLHSLGWLDPDLLIETLTTYIL